ncbi:transferase [Ideonella sp. A 288]|uniref:spermine/spermidine synthase domain-containing protein n=1 Tax=Ideonella sp. A 288 TaxID=1962181 RepID=UPI000B4A6A00|nr:transferase [Ideonella sp. A 288]
MSESPGPDGHVKPFVFESRGAKALHFSICEVQSRMRVDDPNALDLEYTRTMMGFLLFVPNPRRIGMVGLGGGSLAKFCHHHLPEASIEVVEINPHVLALRDEFAIPPDGERFQVVLGDGARFVRQHSAAFDVLMIDGFDWEGMPDVLARQRFYDDCAEALQPGGMLVVNLHLGDERHDALVDRLRRSFDGAVLVVVDADKSNSIVFASKGPTLATYRPGIVRLPQGLAREAATQLLGAFSQVTTALRDRKR